MFNTDWTKRTSVRHGQGKPDLRNGPQIPNLDFGGAGFEFDDDGANEPMPASAAGLGIGGELPERGPSEFVFEHGGAMSKPGDWRGDFPSVQIRQRVVKRALTAKDVIGV